MHPGMLSNNIEEKLNRPTIIQRSNTKTGNRLKGKEGGGDIQEKELQNFEI